MKQSAAHIRQALESTERTINGLRGIQFQGVSAALIISKFDEVNQQMISAPNLVNQFATFLNVAAQRFVIADQSLESTKP